MALVSVHSFASATLRDNVLTSVEPRSGTCGRHLHSIDVYVGSNATVVDNVIKDFVENGIFTIKDRSDLLVLRNRFVKERIGGGQGVNYITRPGDIVTVRRNVFDTASELRPMFPVFGFGSGELQLVRNVMHRASGNVIGGGAGPVPGNTILGAADERPRHRHRTRRLRSRGRRQRRNLIQGRHPGLRRVDVHPRQRLSRERRPRL